MNRCPRCRGPVHYHPEHLDSAYGQAAYLCRRYPACPGVVRVGPSDTAVYRREQPLSVPARRRTVAEMLEGEWL